MRSKVVFVLTRTDWTRDIVEVIGVCRSGRSVTKCIKREVKSMIYGNYNLRLRYGKRFVHDYEAFLDKNIIDVDNMVIYDGNEVLFTYDTRKIILD